MIFRLWWDQILSLVRWFSITNQRQSALPRADINTWNDATFGKWVTQVFKISIGSQIKSNHPLFPLRSWKRQSYQPDRILKLLDIKASPRKVLQWHIPETTCQLLHRRVNQGWSQGPCKRRGGVSHSETQLIVFGIDKPDYCGTIYHVFSDRQCMTSKTQLVHSNSNYCTLMVATALFLSVTQLMVIQSSCP